jgi:hypothetical protein
MWFSSASSKTSPGTPLLPPLVSAFFFFIFFFRFRIMAAMPQQNDAPSGGVDLKVGAAVCIDGK